jgi:hypothetical protein
VGQGHILRLLWQAGQGHAVERIQHGGHKVVGVARDGAQSAGSPSSCRAGALSRLAPQFPRTEGLRRPPSTVVRTQPCPEFLIWHQVLVFCPPVSINAVPTVPLEDTAALRAHLWGLGWLACVATSAGRHGSLVLLSDVICCFLMCGPQYNL